jgi:DNA polymerase (family 10)
MPELNKRVASQLRQIAALLEEQNVPWKPAAYRRAAQVIEDLPRDVGSFKTEKALMELPGVGEAIAAKVLEYVKTGEIMFLEQLRAEQGGLPAELMEVEDLGPKRVRQLQSLGITTVADLTKAAEAGKLRSLPRFSETIEKKILTNAKRVKERTQRFPREQVRKDVETIMKTLTKVPGVEKAEAAGSYRREKETIGDLDVVAVARNREKVMDAIAKLRIVRDVVARGPTKMSLNLKSGLRVDIRFVERAQWGSALLYFTGNKEHNIFLRRKAMDRGWKLNEYGLFEGEKVIASREERDIYQALGVPMIEPKERV